MGKSSRKRKTSVKSVPAGDPENNGEEVKKSIEEQISVLQSEESTGSSEK